MYYLAGVAKELQALFRMSLAKEWLMNGYAIVKALAHCLTQILLILLLYFLERDHMMALKAAHGLVRLYAATTQKLSAVSASGLSLLSRIAASTILNSFLDGSHVKHIIYNIIILKILHSFRHLS